MMTLEICADSVDSAVAAELGGAQRIELCSALLEGGLTPSLGLIRAVRARVGIGIHVMIRPRGGDFFYSADEFNVMREDIALAAECAVDGVVLGLLTTDSTVDVERTRELVELARPMEVTFHRAIDMTPNLDAALEAIVQTGANRILTSGGQSSAVQGRAQIHGLVEAANGRIQIMAGGGVRPENVVELIRETGANDFHSALRSTQPSPVTQQARGVYMGDPSVDEYARSVVRVEDVRLLRQTMDAALSQDRTGA